MFSTWHAGVSMQLPMLPQMQAFIRSRHDMSSSIAIDNNLYAYCPCLICAKARRKIVVMSMRSYTSCLKANRGKKYIHTYIKTGWYSNRPLTVYRLDVTCTTQWYIIWRVPMLSRHTYVDRSVAQCDATMTVRSESMPCRATFWPICQTYVGTRRYLVEIFFFLIRPVPGLISKR